MNRSDARFAAPFLPVYQGLVLLGPTGSGKTPLGCLMGQQGLWSRWCVHFDFGAQLRRIAVDFPTEAGPPQPESSTDLFRLFPRTTGKNYRPGEKCPCLSQYFTDQEREFVRQVLRRGALLEDEHFPLALKILQYFLLSEGLRRTDLAPFAAHPLPKAEVFSPAPLLVLNGLPRHVGQAEALRRWVDVQAVIHLECPAEVVLERICTNVGGDRQGRTDDDLASVQAKLAVYEARTRPLIDYYQKQGVPVVCLEVTATMRPADVWMQLQTKNPWSGPKA